MGSEARGYLGLELAGAKNQKTALAALEYYPREDKIFLLDIYDRIVNEDNQTGDEALLDLISEHRGNASRMGVNVPLTLPPCVTCTRKVCPMPSKCTVPAVKWMREATKRAAKHADDHGMRVREFTPYTQRPVELLLRYSLLPELPVSHRFEIDETLGGNRAPLTARMHFLKNHFKGLELVEVLPKLTVAILTHELGIPRRTVSTYRHLEEGILSREQILETLADRHGIFIYDRDIRKLSQSLPAFDAFICAYTALLSDTEQCAKIPAGYPLPSGWTEFPILEPGT
ncbi:MAG: hypothetical protein ACXWP5_01060 [Bdellovibrionota bacterium]